MSNTGFKVRFDENGDIVDILGGGVLKALPRKKQAAFHRDPDQRVPLSGEHHPEGGADPTWVEGAPGQGREPGARGHRRLRVQGRLPEP